MNRLVVIIPTYNRPEYLYRILNYYNSFGSPYDYIVADSSKPENKTVNRSVISSFPNLSISYLSEYSDDTNLYVKFADVVKRLKAEYCVFCADDDFMVPESINKAVQFLDDNPDYVAAHGQYISLFLDQSKHQRPKVTWNFAYAPVSVESDDPSERFKYQFSAYRTPTFYAVHRTEVLLSASQAALDFKVSLNEFGELVSTLVTVILGKVKCFDTFYAVRFYDAKTRTANTSAMKKAIDLGTYNDIYPNFKKCLSFYVEKYTGSNADESGKLVDTAHDAYVSTHITAAQSRPTRLTAIPFFLYNRLIVLPETHDLPGWMDTIIKGITWAARSSYHRFLEEPRFARLGYSNELTRIEKAVLDSIDAKLPE